jgi:hypothetical protein
VGTKYSIQYERIEQSGQVRDLMKDLFKLILGVLASLFRSRAKLEAEILILRQQINVLRRWAPKRPNLNSTDCFLFVWLYHWFPSVLGAIAIVRPETIIRWHRAGFRAYWRWRSRNPVGRPKVSAELRTLIGEMSRANPLCGAPHIHGELLKLGFEVAQSTVARYMCRSKLPPSQGWRTFLHNHADGIAAVDLFVLPTIAFRILYCLVNHTAWTTNLAVVWRDGKPDCGVDLAPDHRGTPMGPRAAIPHSGSGHLVRASLRAASARHRHSRSADCVPITLAKRLR